MAAAACSRANLQRAFITKKEAGRLAEVEKALLASEPCLWLALRLL